MKQKSKRARTVERIIAKLRRDSIGLEAPTPGQVMGALKQAYDAGGRAALIAAKKQREASQ